MKNGHFSFNELDNVLLDMIENNMFRTVNEYETRDFYIKEMSDSIYLTDKQGDYREMLVDRAFTIDEMIGKRLKLKKKGYYGKKHMQNDIPAFVVIETVENGLKYNISGDDGYIFLDRYPTINPVTPLMSSEMYENRFCRYIVDL